MGNADCVGLIAARDAAGQALAEANVKVTEARAKVDDSYRNLGFDEKNPIVETLSTAVGLLLANPESLPSLASLLTQSAGAVALMGISGIGYYFLDVWNLAQAASAANAAFLAWCQANNTYIENCTFGSASDCNYPDTPVIELPLHPPVQIQPKS